MKIRSVIFDMDGTLLNTLQMIMECNNEILERNGFPRRSYEEYKTFVGDGMMTLLKRALPQGTDDETARKLIPQVLELYNSTDMNTIHPYDGVTELLDILVSMGIKISILTNKEHKYAVLNTQAVLPEYNFEAVLGERAGKPLKPDPYGIYEISEITGVPLNETVFVGDMKADILTGRNAGVFTFGCLWGFGNKEDLEEADRLISHPLEIIQSPKNKHYIFK